MIPQQRHVVYGSSQTALCACAMKLIVMNWIIWPLMSQILSSYLVAR